MVFALHVCCTGAKALMQCVLVETMENHESGRVYFPQGPGCAQTRW